MRRVAPLAATALILGTTVLGTAALSGCAPEQQAARVETIPQASREDTSSMTPLERGKARRAALDEMRIVVKAWDEMDETTLKEHVPASVLKKFQKNWDAYQAEGLKIQRKRTDVYLDVTEMNNAGTQASVIFRFDDNSVLVDSSGKVVRKLKPVEKAEATVTMEDKDGEWKLVRMFLAEDAYR